ncbi:MAG: FHA domain-containing protein [Betaproteobacteria bacterium]|nr:MAG: FHA domain-containing protein [Betaproteobacteria bacterium]
MEGQVLKEIQLSKERTTIGRKPHNDIQIDNLAVSGEHAAIVSIHNDCFLEDLGSTNGTQVNGQAVKKHFLQNNDLIELGKYKLKYVQEIAPAAAAAPAVEKADFEKTMVLRPSAMRAAAEQAKAMAAAGAPAATADAMRAAAVKQAAATAAASGIAERETRAAPPAPIAAPAAPPTPAKPVAQPATSAAPAQTAPSAASVAPAAPTAPAPSAAPKPLAAAIKLLSGANAGKELELSKPLTTLGRPGVQVAVLTRRPQGYFITHVEGAQQPAVNGQAIGTAAHALKDHDLIEIAGIKLEFFLKG